MIDKLNQFNRLKLLSNELKTNRHTVKTKSPETGPEEDEVKSKISGFSLESEEERILDESLFFTCDRLKMMQEE